MITAAEELYSATEGRTLTERHDFRAVLAAILARIMDELGTIDRADWSDALEEAAKVTGGEISPW